MLSICIPTYRYDVRPLVAELLRQVETVEVPVEILVYDDASPGNGDWGKTGLRQTPGIRYVELGTNLGRAAIRNKMAREASFGYLAFLDADSWPGQDYLRFHIGEIFGVKDIDSANDVKAICIGGRTYQDTPPNDFLLHLHWWYGTQRESRSIDRRTEEGWFGFQTNNFLILRSLLLERPFPEAVVGYGHEDTVWGQQFIGTEISLFQFHNPVIHTVWSPTTSSCANNGRQ